MITDVLFEAEEEIKRYLAEMPDVYGERGEPTREQIEHLLKHMLCVRMIPGLDGAPAGNARHAIHVQDDESALISAASDDRGSVVIGITVGGHTLVTSGAPECSREVAAMIVRAADTAEKIRRSHGTHGKPLD